MKYIDIEEIKTIATDILYNIHIFCVDHNIKYSIAYGSLIGAIRHKGFIPWDDDIDIIMPRSDYDRFINSFNDASGKYILHSLHNDNEYNYPYAKVEDSRTCWVEEVSAKRMGIAIDVFPIDYAGNSEEDYLTLLHEIDKKKFWYRGKLFWPNKNNSFIKKIGIIAVKILAIFKSSRSLAIAIESISKKYSKKTTFSGMLFAVYGEKEIMPTEWFDEVELMPFGNHCFYALKQYDNYLCHIYGDYMQLPPLEKRHSPHSLKDVYWKE